MVDYLPCTDELCAGVIGDDGVCTICGASNAEAISSEGIESRKPCIDGNCLGVAGANGYCTECGAFISDPDDSDTEDVDMGEDRRPCADGACIGVIGDDGLCTECGASIGEAGFDDGAEEDEDWASETYGDSDDDEAEDEEEDDRIPCPDGACIGIIGDDGLCTECGRSQEDAE